MKLSKAKTAKIRTWLQDRNTRECPFASLYKRERMRDAEWRRFEGNYCKPVCQTLFRQAAESGDCPCTLYAKDTVIRKVRALIREQA